MFKWTWNKCYLTQTSFLSIHCLPYRSVHLPLPYMYTCHTDLCILLSSAAPALWVWNLSPTEGRSYCSDYLVVYLNSLLEKHHMDLGTVKASCEPYLSCKHCFLCLLLLSLYLEQCLFQADQQLLWLGCDGRAAKCCFSSLPPIFVYLLCLLLFSHNILKKFATSQVSLLCWELAKSWYQSYKVTVQQWGWKQ